MFSRKHKSSFTVLGPDISIDGDLEATAHLHLDGRVDGDIKCAALVQGETSEIIGKVVAENAQVAGKIKGSITADTVVILKTARIEGDVTYGTLSIDEGAQVEGNFSNRAAEPRLMLAGGTETV
jgi:cytoskeletal protein CcmA (bactofilin family)